MKLYYFILFFVIGLISIVSAQEVLTIKGIVKDKFSGEPLIGANIYCETGTISNEHGIFSLSLVNQGSHNLEVTYVGYKDYNGVFIPSNNEFIYIELEPGLNLEEINIHAIHKIEERVEIGTVEISPQQIKTLPIFGDADVLKALQLMPGVQGGNNGRNGFYVRGGSPDQNLFMLDGISLYYVNHLGGFISVFHPEILKNVKLYKGGFPARYGNRLSSIIDLRMKEGNKKEHHGSWGVGLISGDLTMEGPINKKTSYIVSTRRMWFDLLTRPALKIGTKYFSMGYNFYDFFGKISHEVDQYNRLYLSLYGGDDNLGFYSEIKTEDSKGYLKYKWGNILGTIRWNHIYSANLFSDITCYYTRYRYKQNQFGEVEDDQNKMIYKSGLYDIGMKADYNWFLNNWMNIRFGGGLSRNWFKPGMIKFYNKSESVENESVLGGQNKVNTLNSFVYFENEFHLLSKLSFNIGGRLRNLYIGSTNYFQFEPRLMANYQFQNSGAIKLGYSKMSQSVHMLSYSGNSFPTDIWLPSNENIRPAIANQYSLAYVRSLVNGKYEFSAEVYYKELMHLLEIKSGTSLINTKNWDQNVEKEGSGSSKGLELMIQKKQGKTTGWISYSLAKADRQFDNINNGNPYPFSYDRRHDISIVFNHRISDKTDFSATWTYGTGYPITLHNGVYQTISANSYFDNSTNTFCANNEAYLYPGKNWLRMRDNHRLDIGFNFHKTKGKKERIWTLGIYNVYNQQNAVFYYFAHRDQQSKNPIVLYQQSGFPFIPSIKYSVKF